MVLNVAVVVSMVVSNGGVDGGVEWWCRCGCGFFVGGCINLEKNETRSRYTIIEMQFGTTFTFIFGTRKSPIWK